MEVNGVANYLARVSFITNNSVFWDGDPLVFFLIQLQQTMYLCFLWNKTQVMLGVGRLISGLKSVVQPPFVRASDAGQLPLGLVAFVAAMQASCLLSYCSAACRHDGALVREEAYCLPSY
jgi:hypothetical protein